MLTRPSRADDRLILALDVPSAVAGLDLAQRLGDSVSFYKIGLGMLTAADWPSPTSSSRFTASASFST